MESDAKFEIRAKLTLGANISGHHLQTQEKVLKKHSHSNVRRMIFKRIVQISERKKPRWENSRRLSQLHRQNADGSARRYILEGST